jgi:hypothetical protein
MRSYVDKKNIFFSAIFLQKRWRKLRIIFQSDVRRGGKFDKFYCFFLLAQIRARSATAENICIGVK